MTPPTEITEADIRAEQERLCAQMALTVDEAYAGLAAGEFHGSIFASRMHALRFMLGEDK